MYMRPPNQSNLAPAPSGPGMNPTVRFYELLDALKMEYDLSVQQTHNYDSGNKISFNDYEAKVQQQAIEMSHMQKTIIELEKAFHKMKQEYEEEIARLKRGDEISEDHRPLLPSSTAGQVALSGLHSGIGEKRQLAQMTLSAATPHEEQRNVRMRENSASSAAGGGGGGGGAIGDIATAAMASAGSISNTSTTNNPAYDWIVTYNPKAQRLLSIDLLQSINFSGVVCCVRFSNSGNFLAASGNKLCNIYDVRTGQEVLSLPHDSVDGGDLYVRALSFNSSDTLFAAGSEDNSIRVWDISKFGNEPKLIQTLKGHDQEVYALEFIDDERIVSGSGDQSLKIWNVHAGECLASIQSELPEASVQRESGITSLSISADRKKIVTGSLDRLVRVYGLLINEIDGESAEIRLIETFEGHEDSVYSVTFDSSDETVISGSLDKTIRKWSLDSVGPKCLQVIPSHRDFVLSVAVTNQSPGKPSRPFIISGSKDRSVQFWDEVSLSNQLTLQGHKNSVISVAISPSGGVFATGSGDGRARIWSFTSKFD